MSLRNRKHASNDQQREESKQEKDKDHSTRFHKSRNTSHPNKMQFWYWVLHISSAIVRFIVHYIFALFYCGKGKVVPNIKNPLLLKSATTLAEEIRDGKLKSEVVVHAYMERISEVDPYINATVDRRFLDAMAEAKQVDLLIASGNYTKEQLAKEKPLLGVPVSIKVLLLVKGLRSTAGSKLFENLRATEDSPSVALMKEAGAIVIATTNSAEMGMHFETNNKAHGKTRNPYDTHRISGGSSGGESALISAGGSVLGLGNDLLGSIRVPCHFTGLFGHKPTVGLVPNLGCLPAPDPKVEHMLYTGPMCRYAEDLLTSMKVLSSKSEIQIDFEQKVDFRNLKIYYMKGIRGPLVAPVNKDIKRGIENAVSYFKNNFGVKAEEITMPSLYDSSRAVISALMSRVKDLKGTLTSGKGTLINERMDLIKYIFGKSTLSRDPLTVLNGAKISFIYNKNKVSYYEELIKSWKMEFDSFLDEKSVLLMPTLPMTAPYFSEIMVFLPSTCHTSIFNVLGFPSTQCPLGFNSDGMPYGMQIVGCKNNDLLTIACAVELEKVFGGWKPPGNDELCQVSTI